MASIRVLPSGRYNVQITDRGKHITSATFDSEEEAREWAKRQRKPMGKRRIAPRKRRSKPEGPRFFDLAKQYCIQVLNGRSSALITSRRMEHIAQRLPEYLSDIDRYVVNEYRLKRLQEVSSTTCRDELQLINRVYRWAYREMILDEDEYPSPCRNIPMPSPSKPRSRIVEKHEVELLMSALQPVMAAIVELAYETAMRRSEIINLTPRDLNLEERTLWVIDGKTGDRLVPLTTRATGILSEALKGCTGPKSRLFPVAPHSVSTAFRRARQKVGLDDDVRFHQLRHTRISIVARKGFNQAQIMMVSGHRDVRSVQRYTHLNAADVVKLLD